MKRLGLLMLAACVMTAGCDDDPTGPTNLPLVFTANMAATNETAAVTGQELAGTGAATVTIHVTRDSANNITGGTVDMNFQLHRLPALGCATRQVVHRHRDDAGGARHQLGRARTLQPVRGHVGHVAVEARGQPLQKPRFGRRQVHAGHADLGESELAAPPADGRHQRRTVDLTAGPSHPPIVETGSRPGSAVLRWDGEDDTLAFARRLADRPALGDAFIALLGGILERI